MSRGGVASSFRRQFAKRLRQLREAHRPPLTSTGLAVRAGVSIPYVSQLESGVRAPSLSALIALADALGCEPWELLLLNPDSSVSALFQAIRDRDWKAVDAALQAIGMPPRPPGP